MSDELATEVLNDWNARLLSAIDILSQTLDVTLMNSVQDILDRLINAC